MIENEKKSYWRDPLIAFGRMSGWVIGPILLALLGGKWLDAKYNTGQLFFLGLTALAFITSIAGLIKETNKYLKNIKKNDTQNANNTTTDQS